MPRWCCSCSRRAPGRSSSSSPSSQETHAPNALLPHHTTPAPLASLAGPAISPRHVVGLVGMRAGGKSCLVHSASSPYAAWMEHDERRMMLKPSIRKQVLLAGRMWVAHAVRRGWLRGAEADHQGLLEQEPHAERIATAVRGLLGPGRVQDVDPEHFLLLSELGVFEAILTNSSSNNGELVSREQSQSEAHEEEHAAMLNAREMIQECNPNALFHDATYVPTKRQVQLFRAPTLAVCETPFACACKIVDNPGVQIANENANANDDDAFMMHGYSTPLHHGNITTITYVCGLYGIANRLELEARQVARCYTRACRSGCRDFGIILNQIDACDARSMNANTLARVAERLVRACGEGARDGSAIPIKIGVTCALDFASASVVLKEMSSSSSSSSNAAASARTRFLDCGIVPHVDVPLSHLLGDATCEVSWTRSVFGGYGSSRTVSSLGWSPTRMFLLSKDMQDVVMAFLLCAQQRKQHQHVSCNAHLAPLPYTVLHHILSFVVCFTT